MEFAIIYNEGGVIRLHEYCNRFYILSNANMSKKNNNVETTESVETTTTENVEATATETTETNEAENNETETAENNETETTETETNEQAENDKAKENNEAETTKPEETQQDFTNNVETKPIWKVKVVAKFNRWSFNKGQEYEITKTVLENYDGLFEVL